MNKKSILIVEDENSIAEVLIAYCQKEGYATQYFSGGKGVVDYVAAHTLDLILLDLMLPDIDGISICQQIRRFSQIPVIMTTAKTEEIDRLRGLKCGADDYICKPFSPREVMARIEAVLRRTEQTGANSIQQSEFILQPQSYMASFKNQPLGLTPIEFKILELFLNNIGRVFSRDEILNQAYQDTKDISDRNIDTHIKNIRKKIHAIDASANPISSVYGAGYKFELD